VTFFRAGFSSHVSRHVSGAGSLQCFFGRSRILIWQQI
jgi:hypothetical protein